MSTLDDRRSASLLFDEEIVDRMTRLDEEVMQHAAVREAVEVTRVPSRPSRALQVRALRRGDLTVEQHVLAPLSRARETVLGKDAPGSPRVLLRCERCTEETHATLRAAGVPYCATLDATSLPDAGLLGHMRRDGVEFALLSDADQAEAGIAALQRVAIHPRIYVARPGGPRRQDYGALANCFEIVAAGPDAVLTMGFHPTPQWRGGAIWMPTYPPLHGSAAAVAPAIERLLGERAALWIGVTVTDPGDGLDGLAALLAGGVAREWERLLDAGARARLLS